MLDGGAGEQDSAREIETMLAEHLRGYAA